MPTDALDPGRRYERRMKRNGGEERVYRGESRTAAASPT